MEKKKPTIDEIYKLNVDGLFESTANWFDNAFKKSQAEINRDLYNKINGYSPSSESTGGNVSLGLLLTSLNGSNLYPSRGYLYYNGNDWEFNTPTVSGGGGSSSRIDTIKLFNSAGESFETINLGSANTIGFMAGNNVSLEAVVKEYTNVIKISATGGSGGSSTGGSVDLSSYLTKTEASTTYATKSHTHSAASITNFESAVKVVKVNNAAKADKANELNSAVILWGNRFNGSNNINGNINMGSAGGDSIQLWMNNGNMLDRTNNVLHIGYGLKESSDGEIYLDAYATKVYTDNMSKHYYFKSNVFDINSNQIHFGSETNGGKIYWDAANNAFKIEGNVYATGGITALGVSNNVTTSNNVDFFFNSVTANTFNVIDSIQLSDNLKLKRNAGDFDLVSIDGNVNSFYFDGLTENYYLNTNGEAFFSNLGCDSLNFAGVQNFEIVDANDTGFNIQFTYNGKTYKFFPSEGSVSVS